MPDYSELVEYLRFEAATDLETLEHYKKTGQFILAHNHKVLALRMLRIAREIENGKFIKNPDFQKFVEDEKEGDE